MGVQPPGVVYQTVLEAVGAGRARQDTRTPLTMEIALGPAARSAFKAHAADPGAAVFAAIRRFDLAELEVAVSQEDGTMAMLGLRVPQALFTFALSADGGSLLVDVHRKEMPVSKTFGGAAFVFVFHLVPTDEVVVTQAFFVASKEPPARAPRAAPKRVRGPPPRQPTAGAPEGPEVALNARLAAMKAPVAGGASAAAVVDEDEEDAPAPPRALKRVRAAPAPAPAPEPFGGAVGEEDPARGLFDALTPMMGLAPVPSPPVGDVPELALAAGSPAAAAVGGGPGASPPALDGADFDAFEAELAAMGFDCADFGSNFV